MCRPPAPASNPQQQNAAYSTVPSVEKLPDVSLLLNTPTLSSTSFSGGDHASRVAAAMAESASRKRDSSVLSSTAPRGRSSRIKNVPDSGGGLLVPPQLSGRLAMEPCVLHALIDFFRSECSSMFSFIYIQSTISAA